MKVLVACEFSGLVREAFKEKDHQAHSCDFLPTEIPGQHFQCDVTKLLDLPWDLLVAFPPCTHLCVSGARWFKFKLKKQFDAIQFFMCLANCKVPKIAIENPVGVMSRIWRPPDQIIQPLRFFIFSCKAWRMPLAPLASKYRSMDGDLMLACDPRHAKIGA